MIPPVDIEHDPESAWGLRASRPALARRVEALEARGLVRITPREASGFSWMNGALELHDTELAGESLSSEFWVPAWWVELRAAVTAGEYGVEAAWFRRLVRCAWHCDEFRAGLLALARTVSSVYEPSQSFICTRSQALREAHAAHTQHGRGKAHRTFCMKKRDDEAGDA